MPSADSSAPLQLMADVFATLNKMRPSLKAIHASEHSLTKAYLIWQSDLKSTRVYPCLQAWECGIIGEHCPGMDMVSFWPTITGAHSPDEQARG